MRRLLLGVLLAATAAFGQAPTVTATTSITASVGALTCTGTPGVDVNGVSTMHMVCKVGSALVHTSDSAVPSQPASSITLGVTSGSNSVTWILTKGNTAPDGWQVTATDGTATKFKTGGF